MTQPEIAKVMGCSPRTISRWHRQHYELRAALDAGLVQRAKERRAAAAAEAANFASATRQQLHPATRLEALEMAYEMATAIGVPLSAANPTDAEMRREARRQARNVPVEEEPEQGAPDTAPVDFDDPLAGW